MGKFEISKGKDDRYRFNLRASNGEIIATGEPVLTYEECMAEIAFVKKSCGSPVEDQVAGKSRVYGVKYEIYQDKAGEFRFRLRTSSGDVVCHSEGYRSKASCKNGIKSVEKNAPEAPVISLV